MSTRWPGGIISGTAPTPTGDGPGDLAPGIWTLDQADQYIATGNWPGLGIPDPQFQYVTALLHGDGTNAGQNNTFIDSSPNNFTITRNGNTTQGSFSPYGDLWSNYFNGSAGNNLVTPSSGLPTASGDFTVSTWFYLTSFSANYYVVGGNWQTSGAADEWLIQIQNDGAIRFLTTANTNFSSAGVVKLNTWHYFSASRSGTTVTVSLDGVTLYTYTKSDTLGSATKPIYIGSQWSGSTWNFVGYISNFRFVNSNQSAIPPTAPATAIAGTALLTCQSNRFRDASSNNYSITVNGTPSVQRFSPFQNLATYTTARVGGSGYFDGSGDFLSVPANAAWNLANNSFTIECWSYPTAAQSDKHLFSLNDSGGTGFWVLRYNTGTTPQFIYNNYSLSLTSSTAATINQWNHIAVSSNGSTISLYLNGVRVATSSSTTITNGSANPLIIGSQLNVDRAITGYVSDARVVNGSAIYNPSQSTLTVPTAPLTNVTNTSLLTNFTNAAIFDSDASNDFETVGNAQISTSVFKYGTGSMFFNGTTGNLVAPYSQSYVFGTGNFTVEGWFYFTDVNTTQRGLVALGDGANGSGPVYNTWSLVYRGSEGSNQLRFYRYDGTEYGYDTTGLTLSANTWTHIAVCRVGGVLRIFVNGIAYYSAANSLNFSAVNTNPLRVALQYYGPQSGYGGPRYWPGYIDDLRITNGYGRYWYNFQPPTRAFPNYGGTLPAPTNDPLFAYNTLLLNGDGTNGGQNNTFVDSSTNNFTITRNGNTTQGSFSPYGDLWSNYFDGTTDYLTTPNNAAFGMGTGDFTIETWIYFNAAQTEKHITDSSASGGLFLKTNATNIGIGRAQIAEDTMFNYSFSQGVWYHIAFTRSGSTVRGFVNGTQIGSATNTVNYATGSCFIGAAGDGTRSINGYISNLRIVKGTAVYTAAFTPSTTPLTAITNTSLLTCQSNRFIDNSSNAFALTVNGNVSVQRFSPFEPSAPYSTSVIGGSGYFDGSGDYLSVATGYLTGIGTGNFTVEGWWNFGDFTIRTTYFQRLWSFGTGLANDVTLNVNTSGNLVFRINDAIIAQSSAAMTLNTWSHVALVRSSGTVTIYLNGISVASASNSSNLSTQANGSFFVGSEADGAGGYFFGYCSNLRITNTAVYTSAFTPPTAPVTAISGTSLLANFTNAAIPDYAMQNDLETVGNAQISTSVVKYGTGSLAFDGTGDYLRVPYSKAFAFAGDFTVEFWINYSAHETFGGLVACASSTNPTTGWQLIFNNAADTLLFQASSSFSITTSTALPRNQWNHVAVARNGSSVVIYINGLVAGSGTSSSVFDSGSFPLYVAAERTPLFSFTGYMDDLRITNGIARYVQPFTPPTAALPTY